MRLDWKSGVTTGNGKKMRDFNVENRVARIFSKMQQLVSEGDLRGARNDFSSNRNNSLRPVQDIPVSKLIINSKSNNSIEMIERKELNQNTY
ncbi:MAG: hypothetical protein JW814_02660 [Candidatus Krumholzibacteriota bacterium]|nr:hypothetical protein [Candidatus Krumholzibacteriota bacterium]